MYRAQAALHRHRPSDADQWIAAARRLDKDNAQIHFLSARVARRIGDAAGLRSHLERAAELGWPANQLEREWILAQAQAGMLQQAEPHLQELLLNPGDDGAEILAAYINGFVHHYRFARAHKLLEVWEKDFPQDPQPHVMRGKLQHRWKNLPLAEREFRAALLRDPDTFEARFGLAQVLAGQHKYQEAERQFQACLSERPGDPDLLSGWADCLVNLGRMEEAGDVLRRIIATRPDDCFARLGLAKIAMAADRVEEALEWLTPAVKTCPKRPDLRYVYAQALLAGGRRDEAAGHFEYFDEANSALRRVSELTLHLVSEPDDLQARFEVGRLYIQYGSAEEGANWLKTVLAVDDDHRPTHQLLAEYYEQTGDSEQARHHRTFLEQAARPDTSGNGQIELDSDTRLATLSQ